VVKLQPSKLVMWVRFPSPAFSGGQMTEYQQFFSALRFMFAGEEDKSNRGDGDNLRKTEIRKKFSSTQELSLSYLTICLCLS
jgi:hypothetical protein